MSLNDPVADLLTRIRNAQQAQKKWVDVPSDKGWLIVNSGDMLNKCSNNYYPSTIHRVINPKNTNNNVSRYSMPLFLHPRDEVVLNDKYTAKSYLEKRLKSLGLK